MRLIVCIPTYNQARYLRLAVASVLAQTGCEVEVWVSDDCSTDETPDVMGEFSGDKRVHYHRWIKNQGIAANASWLMTQGDSEYIVRLDSDDLLRPDYCSTLLEMMAAEPHAAVAHGGVEEIDQYGVHRRLRLLRRNTGYEEPDIALRAATMGYRVAANICMFRRSALDAVGLIYRPGMNFCEDWDLFARLAVAGWGNVYNATVLASYRVWTDAVGYRAGRKLIELTGTRQVFEQTLAPAFRSRGWSESPLMGARERLACGQARALLIVPKASSDYSAIIQALLDLGDCAGLRFRLKLIRCGAGGLLDVYASVQVKVKDWVKLILRKITGRG